MKRSNDWRKCGEALFAELGVRWKRFTEDWSDRKSRSELHLELPGVKWSLTPAPPPTPAFRDAITKFREGGDPSDLVEYLRSDEPIDASERSILANIIERRPKPHRPPNNDLRFATTLAVNIYKEWRSRNRQTKVKDHGHAEEMRTASAQFVAETFFYEMDAEAVRDLMDRPQKRHEISTGELTLKYRQK